MTRERTTKKQQELYQYIAAFLAQHNYAPSYREIMSALGYKSVSTVAVHVDGLISKGYLVKHEKSARSIRLSTEVSGDDSHLTWLRNEITKRETAHASTAEIDTLKQALAILEGHPHEAV
jgi:SOS-response transcriptional repressor LexA